MGKKMWSLDTVRYWSLSGFVFFPSFPFFIFFTSAWGIYKLPSLRIPGLLLIPLKQCVWWNWVTLCVGVGHGFSKPDLSAINVFLCILSAQCNCHLRLVQQCSSTLAQNALKVTSTWLYQLFLVALVTFCSLLVWSWERCSEAALL